MCKSLFQQVHPWQVHLWWQHLWQVQISWHPNAQVHPFPGPDITHMLFHYPMYHCLGCHISSTWPHSFHKGCHQTGTTLCQDCPFKWTKDCPYQWKSKWECIIRQSWKAGRSIGLCLPLVIEGHEFLLFHCSGEYLSFMIWQNCWIKHSLMYLRCYFPETSSLQDLT